MHVRKFVEGRQYGTFSHLHIVIGMVVVAATRAAEARPLFSLFLCPFFSALVLALPSFPRFAFAGLQ